MARKAKEMAAVLINIYTDHHKHFMLTQNEFTVIAGKKKMRTQFLSTVDGFLRKRGYALIDLHKEGGIIGIVHIEEVMQWDTPKMQANIPESEVPQEDQEKEDDKVFNT